MKFRSLKHAAALAIAAAGAIFAFGASVNADTTPAPTPPPTVAPAASTIYEGKITAVDTTANTVTIHVRKTNADVTFTVSATTKITLDNKAATLANVKIDMHGRVKSADGKAADELSARTHHAKNATPAAPAPAPAAPAQ